jgi:hypothetical protein
VHQLTTLYHLARADFLERVRRPSFLLLLGCTIGIGTFLVPPLDASYVTLDLDGYRGIYNSAWVGSLVAMLAAVSLWFFGFYLVNNAIQRDRRTGVGQILAATPLRNGVYLLGKWLSNLAFLGTIVAILAVAALAMQLIRGEVLRVEPWALFSPFLFVGLTTAALVAAIALLFETLPGLRGGLGNVAYVFFSFGTLLAASYLGWDPLGIEVMESSITAGLNAEFPGNGGSFGVGFTPLRGRLAEWIESTGFATLPDGLQAFHWEGMAWTSQILLERLAWLGVALGLLVLAALFFDRFDPARRSFRRIRRDSPPGVGGLSMNQQLKEEALARPVPLARRQAAPRSFRFSQVLLAELCLIWRQLPWWWVAVMAGLVLACLFASMDQVRRLFLPLAWICPILIWSAMGVREVRHHTGPLVFSAAHPLRRQLPAMWLAGVIVAALAGSGAALRLALAGDGPALGAWLVGALFIPTLALALGVWSGGGKAFQVVYTVLWYAGPMNRVPALDFLGALEESVAAGIPLYFLALTTILGGLAVLGRKRQIGRQEIIA